MVPIPWYGEQKHLGRAGREQSAMGVREACPAWGSKRCKSNGPRHTGNQNHHCKVCGRPFIFDATKGVMTEEQRPLGERLRCEQRSLPGLCRAVGVRMRWRRHCIVPCCATLPAHLHGRPGASPRAGLLGRLEVEADEMGRCVQPKANTQGVWRALDTQTRHILAFHIGGLQPRAGTTVVGAWAGSIPRAGDVLDGARCRLHRDHADGPPESHHAARPETQS